MDDHADAIAGDGNSTDDEYFIVIDRRAFNPVSNPAYVIDFYMPLLGATAMGIYSAYCRLASLNSAPDRGISSIRYMADHCRVGKATVAKINQMLSDCELILIETPDDWEKSRHIGNRVSLLDPPISLSPEIIAKYGRDDYQPMCAWLYTQEPSPDRVPNQVRGDKSAYPDRYALLIPRTQPGTRSERSAYPDRYAKTLLNNTQQNLIQEEDSLLSMSNESECETPGVMSNGERDIIVGQFKANLFTALKKHNWIGSGWTWSETSIASIVANEARLTGDAINYAIDQWYDSDKDRDAFSPVFTLNWLITVCQNYTPGASNGTNGYNPGKKKTKESAGYEYRGGAEPLDTPYTGPYSDYSGILAKLNG